MHNAGAVGQGNIVIADYVPALFPGIRHAVETVQLLVFHAAQVAAGHGFEHLALVRVLAEHAVDQRFGQVVGSAFQLKLRVGLVRVHAQGHVAWQRPGRGGPGEDIGMLAALHPKAHKRGGIANLLVPLRHLVAA